MDPLNNRKKHLEKVRRIVVKVGSNVLSNKDGLNTRRIGTLASQVSNCLARGREIVLVSSGAVSSGFKKVGLERRPTVISQQQACAAVGQAGLIMAYEKAFLRRGHKVAQVLLTASDLFHRRRYLNARNTLSTLLDWKVIPIINENDTVAFNEIQFGDNDTLAGMITELVEADLFINLTDIEGMYDRDPRQDEEAKFLPEVEMVNGDIESMAGRTPGALGAGGMYTKVVAARRVARRGVPSIIANGRKPRILEKLILEMASEGTLFLPRSERLSQRKHWIAFTSKPRGRVIVDDGAKLALIKRGKSLLPSGVISVEDHFDMSDSIQVVDKEGRLVAVGLSNYSSEDLRLIAGCRSCIIEDRLGYKNSDEVIHRDNMVVGEDLNL